MNEPPIPADADLKDFPFTPLYRARLFGSSFHARADDSEWRAGVTLWLKSQDQIPAGSLPDDDIDLCRLAELGRDLKTWRKVKDGALRGWHKCSDGRLYHDVVAEVVNDQWQSKLAQRDRTRKAREARLSQRLSQSRDPSVTENVTDGNIVCGEQQNPSKGQGQGQGERSSEAIASAGQPAIETPLDLKRELWRVGKAYLEKQGMTRDTAGSLIGKWRRDYDDEAVIRALAAADAECCGDAVEFITACLQRGAGKRGRVNGHGPATKLAEGMALALNDRERRREAERSADSRAADRPDVPLLDG